MSEWVNEWVTECVIEWVVPWSSVVPGKHSQSNIIHRVLNQNVCRRDASVRPSYFYLITRSRCRFHDVRITEVVQLQNRIWDNLVGDLTHLLFRITKFSVLRSCLRSCSYTTILVLWCKSELTIPVSLLGNRWQFYYFSSVNFKKKGHIRALFVLLVRYAVLIM